MNGALWVLHRTALLKQAIPQGICIISNQHGQDDLTDAPGGFIRVPCDEVVAITFDAATALDFPHIADEDLERWCVASAALLKQSRFPRDPYFARPTTVGARPMKAAPSDDEVMVFRNGDLQPAARTVMPHHLRHDDRPPTREQQEEMKADLIVEALRNEPPMAQDPAYGDDAGPAE